jgi:hypothetical protein
MFILSTAVFCLRLSLLSFYYFILFLLDLFFFFFFFTCIPINRFVKRETIIIPSYFPILVQQVLILIVH